MCFIFTSLVLIKEIAKTKGLKSTRSLRLDINKSESKYKKHNSLKTI